MKFNILGALIAAPMIAFSGAALAGLGGHEVEGYGSLNTISIDPGGNVCQIISVHDDGSIFVAYGTKGRVFIKFDTKTNIATVTARCNITGLGGDFLDEYYDEQFRCYVHLNKGYHVYQDVDPSLDDTAVTTLRLRDGKARLSCSGEYHGDSISPPR